MKNQRIKDILGTFLVTSILFTTSLSAFGYVEEIKAVAKSTIQIKINDEDMILTRTPVVVNDYVYVPIRDVATNMNKNVYWDKATQTVNMIDTPSDLNDETKEFLYGTWKVDNVAGVSSSFEGETPDILGTEIQIGADKFSSMELEGYSKFQYNYANPIYQISNTYPDSATFSETQQADLPILENATDIKNILIYKADKSDYTTFSLITVDNEKLILALRDGIYFELVKQ